MQSHPITMHLDRMECRLLDRDTSYTDSVSPVLRLVTYVDSSACSPCTLNRLYARNDFLDEARQYKGKLNFLPELKGKVKASDNYILVKCRLKDK